MSDHSSQRLPVNPRRHKVPLNQRKRVVTACNACNIRRIKCSGETTCSQCSSSSRECIYPIASSKVSISQLELDNLKKRIESYERLLLDFIPDQDQRNQLLAQQPLLCAALEIPSSSDLHPSPVGSGTISLVEDELTVAAVTIGGRLLHDTNGTARYHGETSDVAFVDEVKVYLRESLSPGQISMLPSTVGRCNAASPLPSSAASWVGGGDQYYFPSPHTTKAMLTILKSFIQDGSEDGVYPSGGILWWGNLDVAPTGIPPIISPVSVPTDVRNASRLAFYQAALAVASRITVTANPSQQDVGLDTTNSSAFFARARALLGDPLDVSRCSVGQVSVFNMMIYYLLEADMQEAASVHVSLAARIAMSLEMHRGYVDERGKRIFWTLYVLDSWLSHLTGRPTSIPQESISLSQPADAMYMPPAIGLDAHVKLSRISNYITCGFHRVSPSRDTPPTSLDHVMKMLDQWLITLPEPLKLLNQAFSMDPATCMLHMHHNQLIIALLRPSFFTAIRTDSSLLFSHQDTLMAAAQRNMDLARHAVTLFRPRRLLHTSLHFVFNAALCFILQGMADGDIEGSSGREVEFAIELFRREAQIGNMYGQNSMTTLQELRVLVSASNNRDDDKQDASEGLDEAWEGHASWMDITEYFGDTEMQGVGLSYEDMQAWINY